MFGPGLTLTLRPDLRERGPWQLMSCLSSVARSYFPYYFLNRKVGTKIIKSLGKVLDDLITAVYSRQASETLRRTAFAKQTRKNP